MRTLENLNWRYATKKFDAIKKISDADLNTLLEVVNLAPSSYGLQPLKVLVIENKEIREKLKEKSWNQAQVTDASHLLVLCSYLKFEEKHINDHIENTASIREMDAALLKGYGDFMKNAIGNLSDEQQKNWNSKQTYIALGHLLDACAEMRIDSVPMEGFDPVGYDEILHLTAQNLHASLVCPIGYRSEEDATQHQKKVRKDLQSLVEFIK
jgi:nitroreductase